MVEIIVSILGIFLFLFIFWRRLREDYIANQIFSTSFFILIGIGILYLITRFYFSDWWFWAVFVGALSGMTLGSLKYRMRFFEVLEGGVVALMPWLTLLLLTNAFINKSIVILISAIFVILMIVLFSILDSRYKTFTWYKSGRAGFSGLTVLGLFFLIRSGVAMFTPDMLSFVGKRDAIISGVTAFVFFFSLFSLARKSS